MHVTPELEDKLRVRIDKMEASSKREADAHSKTSPVASEKPLGSDDTGPEGPSTPPMPDMPSPTPSPPYLPDTRPAVVVMSKDTSQDPPANTWANTTTAQPGGQTTSAGQPSKPSGDGQNDGWTNSVVPTQQTGARPPPMARDEPGWMTNLYLGEAGKQWPTVPSRLRPYVAWIPVALRLPQAIFALVAFATAASMTHPKTCVFEGTDTNDSNVPSSSPSVPTDLLEQLINNAMCLPGRTYKQFSSLEFLVVIHAAAFFWALCFFFGDLLCLGKVRLTREMGGHTSDVTSKKAFESAARWGVPRVAFLGDIFLTFFTFSSACAIAGLRAGFSDLDANYCSGVGSDWCNKMVTACVFGMLTFVSLLPSVLLNSANAVGPW
tara:strand:+ start:13511 stop:14647 length:1137 start_codon:yes stop_codon:yes gene_type:complete